MDNTLEEKIKKQIDVVRTIYSVVREIERLKVENCETSSEEIKRLLMVLRKETMRLSKII